MSRIHLIPYLLFKDIERVLERLAEIKEKYGELALPLGRKKALKAKWKAAARMGALFSRMAGGKLPEVRYTINCSVFKTIFFNNGLAIVKIQFFGNR